MSIPEYQHLYPLFASALDLAVLKARQFLEMHPDLFPSVTVDGRWTVKRTSDLCWQDACFPQMLWTLHDATGDRYWRERAEQYCRLLDTAWTDSRAAGAAFAYYFGGPKRWYEVTIEDGAPDATIRERLLEVGSGQGHSIPAGGDYLDTSPRSYLLTIERVLDVPLMLYAGTETQNQALLDGAARHCAASRRYLVRGDGSIGSAVRMDERSGLRGCPVARGGARADSTWAQSQAWGILGFATAGRLLGFEPWLQTARQAAQFLAERLSGDPVPKWDLDAGPDPAGLPDSAGAAIAAAALLELADAEQTVGADQARLRRNLQEVALRILEKLCSPEYLAGADSGWDGLLRHGVGHLPAGWAVGESSVWGDTFFVRSLQRACRLLKPGR